MNKDLKLALQVCVLGAVVAMSTTFVLSCVEDAEARVRSGRMYRSGQWSRADIDAGPDVGFIDTGIHPDALIPDTGVHPDVYPDADPPDDGVHPDVYADAAPADTGIHADATSGDGGVFAATESVRCDGINDNADNTTTTPTEFDAITQYVVSFWFYSDGWDAGTRETMFGIWDGDTDDDFIQIRHGRTGDCTTSNCAMLYIRGDNDLLVESSVALPDTQWVHLFLSVDLTQSTDADAITFVIDGTEDSSLTFTGTRPTQTNTWGNLELCSGNSANYFDGDLHEVMIWAGATGDQTTAREICGYSTTACADTAAVNPFNSSLGQPTHYWRPTYSTAPTVDDVGEDGDKVHATLNSGASIVTASPW